MSRHYEEKAKVDAARAARESAAQSARALLDDHLRGV
jgi:hypothetical protein